MIKKKRLSGIELFSWATSRSDHLSIYEKGQQLYVEGRLETSKYEKDGIERFSTNIIGESFNFISGSSTSNG